jgi:stage V sporulation protein D (sporulation-specific penicillin-binding protein)
VSPDGGVEVPAPLPGDGARDGQDGGGGAWRVMSEATARSMVAIMRGVTEVGGTAKQAAVDGYPVAGKTGTAQKAVNGHYDASKYVASFVGFAPAQDPRIALIVLMDEPQGVHLGGAVAAPVFKEIAEQALRYLHVPPVGPAVATSAPSAPAAKKSTVSEDDDVVEPDLPPTDAPVAYAGEPDEAIVVAAAPDDSSRAWDEVAGAEGAPAESVAPPEKVMVPSFAGMTMAEAIRTARRSGVELAFDESAGGATGVALRQRPLPGPVARGTLCRVAFGHRE